MITKRRILFVLDCSGSMFNTSGETWRIEGAKIALETALLQLKEGDEFNILYFGNSYKFVFKNFVPFNDSSLYEARHFLSNPPNLGGTELFQALSATIGLPAHNILLLTDGDFGDAPLAPVYILSIGTENNKTFISNFAEKTKAVADFANAKKDVIVATNRLMKHCGNSSSSVLSVGKEEVVVFPEYPIFTGTVVPSLDGLKCQLDGKNLTLPIEILPEELGVIVKQRCASRILQLSNYSDARALTSHQDSNSDREKLTRLAIDNNIVCHLTSLVGVSAKPRSETEWRNYRPKRTCQPFTK
jgi:hypothetical protein